MGNKYKLIKVLYCEVCQDDTVHCETSDDGIRCEICGADNRYSLEEAR